MNNKDNYKKAINQIHAKDTLKAETLEKMKKQNKSNITYMQALSGIAAVVVLAFVGVVAYTQKPKEVLEEKNNAKVSVVETPEIDRFENISDLKRYLRTYSKRHSEELSIDPATVTTAQDTNNLKGEAQVEHSETNNQVEGVDEADIVKTDGDYIYYAENSKIYIVKAKNLELVSIIKYDEDFEPMEIFINKNKLIVLGNFSQVIKDDIETNSKMDYVPTNYKSYSFAKVYDISNKKSPKEDRTVLLDGRYKQARMIDNNIYFISTKYVYYDDMLKDKDILPVYEDTNISNEFKTINCEDIAYFPDSRSNSYMIIGGFNILDNKKVNIETFLGAGDDIYASKDNLYVVVSDYERSTVNSKIYKFALDNGEVKLTAKGEVPGYVNNQFSIDEYKGNLRIATTVDTYRWGNSKTSNRLTILDEGLNQIGVIKDLAKEEDIHSVRFMGDIGYVVTFQEIDPLFVIDLSDPRNPEVKGELKIPGYSSYLHPYDDTHIIGIGYNTKSNGYGGVTNDNMKMTMFDVSDLENPKEMFSVDIGEGYTHSELEYNHKALFYNKSEDLIGFPISYYGARQNTSGFVIYKIDIDKGFELYTDNLIQEGYSTDVVNRVIYIGDILYTLSVEDIVSYNLNTLEKVDRIELED